jgi:hypothetical protein
MHPEAAERQAPGAESINLDHVAHFVPDVDAASTALEQLGFTLTPFSPQSHRLQPDGPLVPAGTGNRCVMLRSGYIEFLTPTASTPLADQLRTAMSRYVGVHLIAFGTSAPERDHARLAAAGFGPAPAVALQRPISTETGEDTARFTVVRVPPGTMPEGRIQFCRHHTPHLVWQARWLEHANHATALSAVILCVEKVPEAVERYSRYTGLPSTSGAHVSCIRTERGALYFVDSATLTRTFGVEPPALPWIAGYALETVQFAATRERLRANDTVLLEREPGRCAVVLRSSLGGLLVFHEPGREAVSFD